MGEYIDSDQELSRLSSGALIKEKFNNKAWQISGTYVLTGENASYKGVTPRQAFDLQQGTWGAFEVAGRYENLDVDDDVFDRGFASIGTQVSQASAWGLGLNWYLSKNIRTTLDFDHTDFRGGGSNGADRKSENVVLTRFQLSY